MRQLLRDSSADPIRHRGASLVQTVTSVGTVVALTTTILIPALIGLRDRNRQAVCTMRIGTLTCAMLTYAADYDETPPFMGIGWENIHYPDRPTQSLSSTAGAPGDMSTKSRWDWAVAETWHSQDPELLWNAQDDPPQRIVDDDDLRTGLLFSYARSENCYRCPAFEQITNPNKSQSVFNYTRTVFGRKWILGPWSEDGPEEDYWGGSDFGAPGPIMRVSEIHRPSWLHLLYDESWYRHVAGSYFEHVPPRDSSVSGSWMATDPLHFPMGDEIGQYHGRPVSGRWLPLTLDSDKLRQGNVASYDGHVELVRTPWPDITDTTDGQLLVGISALFDMLSQQSYAQRGVRIIATQ